MVPHNIPFAVMGAAMLWFGWFGFNAGSALTSGALAGNALLASQIAAATSGMVWIVLSWKKSKKPSLTGVITGAIAGLAGVTPAAWLYQCSKCILSWDHIGFCVILWNITSKATTENR